MTNPNDVEIRLVCSPTASFYGQVSLLVSSIRGLGYDWPIRLFMGTDVPDHPLWDDPPASVELIRVVGENYYAQIDEYFVHPPVSPRVIFSDADIVWLGRIESIIEQVGANTVAGLPAHKAPPGTEFRLRPHETWNSLSMRAVGKEISLDYRSTISNAPIPFYVNYGFVVADSDIFARHGARYINLCRESAASLEQIYMQYQVALSLLVLEADAKTLILGPQFNFSNDERFYERYKRDSDEIKIIHYTKNTFDRANAFSDLTAYRAFLTAELGPVDAIIRSRALALWGDSPPHLKGRADEGGIG